MSPATQPAISAVSSKGSFAVDSYSPTHGSTGILFTVNLTCTNIMTADVVAQLDIRLMIEGKRIYSRIFKGLNGQVTMRALLGDSLASLSGSVPLCIQVIDNGTVFDSCVFGEFNFVAGSNVSPSSKSASNPLKRSREEDESPACPDIKRTKSDSSDDFSTCDPSQATLVVETNIVELADITSWTPVELQDRRRLVRLSRKQRGSNIHLRMTPISSEEARSDDRNIINCMLVPGSGDEAFITSVDIIKTLELLVNPPDRRLSIDEKNRVRRNIDTFRPKTLLKGDEGLSWIMQLRSPRPITISKTVKIFKWSCFEAALEKIMRKYSYQMDGSFMNTPTLPQQASSPSTPIAPTSSWLSANVQPAHGSSFSNKSSIASPVCTPAVKIVQPIPRRPAMPMPQAPPSPIPTAVLFPVDEYFNEAFPATSAPAPVPASATFDINAHFYDMSEPSLASSSMFSTSTTSSVSALGLELLTPVDVPLSYSFDAPLGFSAPLDFQSTSAPILCSADLDAFLQDMLKPTECNLNNFTAGSSTDAGLDFEQFFNNSAAGANAYDSPLF